MRIPFSMDNTSTFNRAKQDSSLKSIQVECLEVECLVSKSSRKTPPFNRLSQTASVVEREYRTETVALNP